MNKNDINNNEASNPEASGDELFLDILKAHIPIKYSQELINFLTIFNAEISKHNIGINFNELKEKIASLKVEDDSKNILDNLTHGIYIPDKELIIIKDSYPHKLHVFMHELLHAISTKIEPNQIVSGLSIKRLGNTYNEIGFGFNEFITEYIHIKLFQIEPSESTDKLITNIYNTIERITNIISYPKLLECYFKTGLMGFQNELIKELNLLNPNDLIRLLSLFDIYYNIWQKIHPAIPENHHIENLISTMEEIEKIVQTFENNLLNEPKKNL